MLLIKSMTISVAAVTLLFTSLAFAVVPQTINYQGYLKNNTGAPVNTQISINFRIYDSPTGGTPLWVETRSVTPQNGIYAVQLGDTGNPLTPDIFSGGPRYLAVQVGIDAEMAPRQPITATPYALHAQTVETVNGTEITDSSITSAKLADNAVTTQSIAAGSITAAKLDTAYVKTSGDSMSGPMVIVSGATLPAMDIRSTNAAYSGDAFKITSLGTGDAFNVYASSTQGRAGFFSTVAALNSSDTLFAITNGGGNAGSFTISNASSTGSALHASSNGAGSAIKAVNSGSGLAGHFLGDVTIAGNLNPGTLSAGSVGTQALMDSSITAAKIGQPISPSKGGIGIDTSAAAAGSILRTNGTGSWAVLPIGTTDQVLKISGGMPVWGSGGTVTSVAAGTGITAAPSPITTSGILSIDTTVVPRLSAANTFSGTQTILTGAQAVQGLVVKGASGQSANLQEWQNNTGTAIASVSPIGDITTAGNIHLPALAPGSGMIYAGASRILNAFNLNFFIGIDAGNQSTSGNLNTAVGRWVLHNNTSGSDNTAFGDSALNQNDAGDYNTASGSSALFYNSSGSFNTATGSSSLYSTTTGTNNTATGNESLFSNTIGLYNTAIGDGSLYYNSTGIHNTSIGYASGDTITTGDQNTFLGALADASANNLTNATAIGYAAAVNASNKVRIGNSGVSVIEGQVAFSNPSDIRLKKDIKDVSHGLNFIKQLRPVEYRMKEGNGKKDFGFIAQEIEALLGTDYNALGIGNNAERTLTLRYTDFIAPLVKAVQEQQTTIEQLKAELAELRKLIRK